MESDLKSVSGHRAAGKIYDQHINLSFQCQIAAKGVYVYYQQPMCVDIHCKYYTLGSSTTPPGVLCGGAI